MGAILTAEAADITGRVVDEKTEKPKEPSTYSTSNPELTENPNTITPGCNGSDKLCKSDTKFYVYQKKSDGTYSDTPGSLSVVKGTALIFAGTGRLYTLLNKEATNWHPKEEDEDSVGKIIIAGGATVTADNRVTAHFAKIDGTLIAPHVRTSNTDGDGDVHADFATVNGSVKAEGLIDIANGQIYGTLTSNKGNVQVDGSTVHENATVIAEEMITARDSTISGRLSSSKHKVQIQRSTVTATGRVEAPTWSIDANSADISGTLSAGSVVLAYYNGEKATVQEGATVEATGKTGIIYAYHSTL